MRSIHVAIVAFALAVPLPGAAQSGAARTDGGSASSQDTTSPAPKKKKGGLFGKVKGLAKNKVVKTVAKTAACTMLPGGQMIAGAIDAADNKDAAGAVGAAAGVATGQTSCMPGAGMLGDPAAAAQQAATAKAAGVAGLTGSVPGVALPGMPTVTGAGLSAKQMKQMQEHYRKMGMDEAQLQAMQEMMASMASGGAPDGEDVLPEERAIAAPSLTREKGRIVLRGIPWMPGYAAIQPGNEPAFGQIIATLAAEILASSKHYKVEVKVENQGDKAKTQVLAQQRAIVVVGALVNQGVAEARLAVAGGGSDKDPRVVLSESKPGK